MAHRPDWWRERLALATSTRFRHTSSLSLKSRIRSVENRRRCSVNTALSALPTGEIADLPDGVVPMVAEQSPKNFYRCPIEATRQHEVPYEVCLPANHLIPLLLRNISRGVVIHLGPHWRSHPPSITGILAIRCSIVNSSGVHLFLIPDNQLTLQNHWPYTYLSTLMTIWSMSRNDVTFVSGRQRISG